MSVFREDDIAKIQVEKIKLEALEKNLKEIKPLYEYLTLEIGLMKDEIKRMEADLDKKQV